MAEGREAIGAGRAWMRLLIVCVPLAFAISVSIASARRDSSLVAPATVGGIDLGSWVATTDMNSPGQPYPVTFQVTAFAQNGVAEPVLKQLKIKSRCTFGPVQGQKVPQPRTETWGFTNFPAWTKVHGQVGFALHTRETIDLDQGRPPGPMSMNITFGSASSASGRIFGLATINGFMCDTGPRVTNTGSEIIYVTFTAHHA